MNQAPTPVMQHVQVRGALGLMSHQAQGCGWDHALADTVSVSSRAPRRFPQCIGCQQLLMCPAGAQRVRCASCGTITGTRQDGPRFTYTACCGCGVMLMHAAGAARVQCAVCGVLTATGGEGPVGDNPSKGSPVKAVFVEQPGGTEMALGIHKLS